MVQVESDGTVVLVVGDPLAGDGGRTAEIFPEYTRRATVSLAVLARGQFDFELWVLDGEFIETETVCLLATEGIVRGH